MQTVDNFSNVSIIPVFLQAYIIPIASHKGTYMETLRLGPICLY